MCKLNLEEILLDNISSNENILENTFPKNIGKDYMEKLHIQEGLLLLKTHFEFLKPTKIKTNQHEKKFVITFGLKGYSNYKSSGKKEIIEFKEGFTTISLFDGSQGIREFTSKKVEQIRLIVNEDFLQKNFENTILNKYGNHKKLNLIDFSPTSVKSERILNEIYAHSNNSEINKLFLQSKILELLYLEINKISAIKNTIKLNTYDKQQILKAKEILLQDLQNPPSIVELAKIVCINEFKLKKGFKQVYKQSPYQFLTKYKLTKAKYLLEEGEYNVNEVAHLMGYKYSNNFSNAFFKEFKINPKECIKNIKYYS